MRFLEISAGSMSAWIDLGVRGERRQLAGHAVVEAGAEGDEQVGLLQGGDGGDGAVHAGHAEVQRVAVGDGAAGHQRGHDGDAGQLDEARAAPRCALAADDAAADVEHRPLGLGDQPGGLADLLAVRARRPGGSRAGRSSAAS